MLSFKRILLATHLVFLGFTVKGCVTSTPLVIERNKVQKPQWAKTEPDEFFKSEGFIHYMSIYSKQDNLPTALKEAVDEAIAKVNQQKRQSEFLELMNDEGKGINPDQLTIELYDLYYEKIKNTPTSKNQRPYYFRIYILLRISP